MVFFLMGALGFRIAAARFLFNALFAGVCLGMIIPSFTY
jgi:hypothetical protein